MRRAGLLLVVAALLPACSEDRELARADGLLRADPASVDFGPVWVGDKAVRTFAVENAGRAPTAASVGGGDSSFEVSPRELSLAASSSVPVEVTFRPSSAGLQQITLAVQGAAGEATVPVAVAGTGVQPNLGLVEELDFGVIRVGETRVLGLSIENRADLAITAPQVRMGGPDADSFRIEREVRQVPAGETAVLQIAFAPIVPGPALAAVTVAACGGCAERRVVLEGRAVAPLLRAVPAVLDFGVVSPGGSRMLSVTIGNDGEAVAAVVDAAAGPPFSVDGSPLPVVLGQGEEVELPITFTPTAMGPATGTLQLLDADGELAFQMQLVGRGGGAIVAVDPPAIALGRVPIGHAGFRTVTLRNVGDPDPVTIEGVTMEGDPAFSAELPGAPLVLGAEPLTFDVHFSFADEGERSSSLVIATSDPEQPRIRIPVTASVIRSDDCAIAGSPVAVRFGLDPAGMQHLRNGWLRNVGSEPCLVANVRLEAGNSESFFLLPVDEPVIELAPDEEAMVTVSFAPMATSAVLETARIVFTTSSTLNPLGEVPVSGFGASPELHGDPDPVDFGELQLGRQRTLSSDLVSSLAQVSSKVVEVRIEPGTPSSFTMPAAPGLPAFVYRGTPLELVARYTALSTRTDRGWLGAVVEGFAEPVLIRLVGKGREGSCGPDCVPPVAICPEAQTVTVNQPVSLAGSASDPAGEAVTCEWAVLSAPSGSSARPTTPTSCTTGFTPDLVGDYFFMLTAFDERGNEASCLTGVRAEPPAAGLWVETFWNTANDVDLHLLHPAGGDPSRTSTWRRMPHDCYYMNRTPQWDEPGTDDDPALDRDDRLGTGPENIRIQVPSTAHPYHVGVQWLIPHTPPEVTVTTNVYCHGVKRGTTIVQLTERWQIIHVGDVQFDAQTGGCSWTPVGEVAR